MSSGAQCILLLERRLLHLRKRVQVALLRDRITRVGIARVVGAEGRPEGIKQLLATLHSDVALN